MIPVEAVLDDLPKRHSRDGGLLIVDDVHIHSVKERARFLSEDPRHRLLRRFDY